VLEIHKVSLDDDAIWVCKAINTAGQAVFKVDLESELLSLMTQLSLCLATEKLTCLVLNLSGLFFR